jgi:mannose-6-phosphate isomerase
MEGPVSSPNLNSLDPWRFEPRRVDKPWGYELIWAHAGEYVGKILFVKAGEALSLQFHNVKDESWYMLQGRAQLEFAALGEAIPSSEVVSAGEAFRLRPGTVHRVKAVEDTTILEASTPHLDDVVRLDDRYGRVDS